MKIPPGFERAINFSLLDSIFSRRSRRFGLGMEIPEGNLAYSSAHDPVPLSELEEAFFDLGGHGNHGSFPGGSPENRHIVAFPVDRQKLAVLLQLPFNRAFLHKRRRRLHGAAF